MTQPVTPEPTTRRRRATPSPADRRLDVVLTLRVTPATAERIGEAARRLELSEAAWCRQQIARGLGLEARHAQPIRRYRSPPVDVREVAALRRDLRGLGDLLKAQAAALMADGRAADGHAVRETLRHIEAALARTGASGAVAGPAEAPRP